MLSLIAALVLSQGIQFTPVGPVPALYDPNRASSSVVLSLPFAQTGAGFAEDPGTVSHVTWNGSALVDSKGNAWTQVGTVPQVAANALPTLSATGAAGPFSGSNRYQSPATSDVFDFTADFRGCAAFTTPETASFPVLISAADNTIAAGWVLSDGTGTGGMRFQYRDSGNNLRQATGTGGQAVINGLNVVCFGVGGGVANVKVNLAATATSPAGTAPTAATGTLSYLGVFVTGGASLQGTLIEIMVGTGAYTDAWATSQMKRYFGIVGTRGEEVSLTRATTATSYVNGQIWNVASGVPRVEADGLLVESARTNYLLNSEDMTAATWTTTGTCAITANQGPAGWTTMESVNCSGGVTDNRGTTPITTLNVAGPVTGCAWVAAVSGTATVTLTGFASSTTISGATCIRSDSGACTVAGNGTNVPYTYATVGTTPVRLCLTGTSGGAPTSWQFSILNGQRNASLGAAILAGYWSAEVGAYPTSYVPVAGTAVARNADYPSVTVSPTFPSGNWTVAVEGRTNMRAWSQPAGTIQALWHLGNYAAANSAFLWQDTGNMFAVTYDGSAAFKYTSASAAAITAGVAHAFKYGNASGVNTLTLDGANVTGSQVGAGNGLWSASPTLLFVGNDSTAARAFNGWIKNLKLCRSSVLARCR